MQDGSTNNETETIQRAPRSLAIEARGTGYREERQPGIRLKGRWLRAAGFIPGRRVTVQFLADGVIQLTATQPTGEPALSIFPTSDDETTRLETGGFFVSRDI